MRLAAKIGSVEFEDVRINFNDWPALKPTTPFGQLPFMNIDDSEPIAQSGAMCVSRARMQPMWLSSMVSLVLNVESAGCATSASWESCIPRIPSKP